MTEETPPGTDDLPTLRHEYDTRGLDVEALDADPLMEEVLGPDLKRSFVELKTAEWWDYHDEISPWEIEHYLTFF